MHPKNTPDLTDLEVPKQADIPADVIPLYGNDNVHKPSKTKIVYDILMLFLLVVDLLLIFMDGILMSAFLTKLAAWANFGGLLDVYQNRHHEMVSAIGGLFTLFWVTEILVRWGIAIRRHTYFRWFFFPFVHWYEVLGCFPALRALRLLRAGVLIKRLHDTGVKVIPEKWLSTTRFYYHVLLEELSDRVILTATDNFRQQMASTSADSQMIQATINKNRAEFEQVILGLLRRELVPKLQERFLHSTNKELSANIGVAVERALLDTPELRRYLKLIPIAGSLIESQITSIGKSIGESVTTAVNHCLFDERLLDGLMVQIAHGVAQIDTSGSDLHQLVAGVVEDALSAFENQVKAQQWKHKEQLKYLQ